MILGIGSIQIYHRFSTMFPSKVKNQVEDYCLNLLIFFRAHWN